jgi:O-succinylbenzoic acid--CoA ligase
LKYQVETIRINQRNVALSAILSGSEAGQSVFEQGVFRFMQAWLNGTDHFTQRTSGSTGTPKEITITRSQMVTSAHRTLSALNISEGDTALVCLAPDFIAGKMMLVRALEFNLKIEAVEPSADPLQHLADDFKNVFAAFVPLQLQTMLNNPHRISQLNRMKTIIAGGAPVSESLRKKLNTLSCPVYATYGMTETLSNIALQKLNGTGAQPWFKTLPGITVKADDRSCLVISVPEISEPVITNDIAEVQSDTSFRILGRWDSLINTGGYKLSPETLEARAEEIVQSFVTRSFLFGSLPHELLGEQLILLIEGNPLAKEVEAKLMDALKSDFLPYEVPKQIRYLTQFSYTPSGKINRRDTLKRLQ